MNALNKYSFKDIAGQMGSPITISQREESEPVELYFVYFDKQGVAWRVEAHGYRFRTGETREPEYEQVTGG